jgi:predicted PurR-regulated permease PerM
MTERKSGNASWHIFYNLTIMTASEPFYKRLSLNLLTLAILAATLYVAQGILVPFFFSVLLATLLLPVTNFLQRRRFPKVLSILITLLVSLLIIVGVVYFLSHQVGNFLQDFDSIRERILKLFTSFQLWIDKTFNINTSKQNQYLRDTAENIKESGAGMVGKTVGTVTEVVSYLVFLPVYTFLILYYKDLIKRFLVSVFGRGSSDKVGEILYESRIIGQYYVMGLLTDMVIVFALNAVGFLILGIQYAIFLALLSALLNLIPYIGMLIANVFSMLVTLVTSEQISDVVWVAAILAVVQFIDNNFLMPLVVGNKVRINALVTILGVVIGGTLCGVSGMFLAIPGIAVLKVIFDRVESLQPWGMILGDHLPEEEKKKSDPIT